MDRSQRVSDLAPRPARSFTVPNGRVLFLFVALTAAGLALISPRLLVSTALDVLGALTVLLPPVMFGLWLVGRFPLGPLPLRWHLLLGAAIGIGLTSLLVLVAGVMGLLHRTLWLTILITFTVLGVLWIRHRRPSPLVSEAKPAHPDSRNLSPYLWLLLFPFLVLAFRAASNAPGFLWSEEGYGYDVLEYHLQLPKEYFESGHIAYVPHNVYANFPANVELLYLLSMIVHNDTYDAGTTANTIHLILGALFVFAAWVLGREWSSTGGLVVALAAGTAGWIVYLSGLAYVENGLLFFGMTALAALFRSTSSAAHPSCPKAWIALAGALAGLACGCKYPAVPMVALPLVLAIPLLSAIPWSLRIRQIGLFMLGCAGSFAPWLVKNALFTGNPVFPLCNNVFHASPEGWGSEQDALWSAGHTPSGSEALLVHWISSLWVHILADPFQRFGPVILLLPLTLVLFRRPGRSECGLLLMLFVQFAVWVSATHLYARFTIPLLIPLSALLGRAVTSMSNVHWRSAVVFCVGAGAVWNFSFAARLNAQEALSAAPETLFSTGQVPGYEYLGYANNTLPKSARLLLIGEARAFYFQRPLDYAVVFNKNAFVEQIRLGRSPQETADWLRARGYTHVLVHWAEVERLRLTYGFATEVCPALFEDLRVAGLNVVRSFPHPHSGAPYVDVYEVPHGLRQNQ